MTTDIQERVAGERPSYIPVVPSHGDYDVEPGQEPVPWKKIAVTVAIIAAVVLVSVLYTIPGYVAGENDKVRARIALCQPVPGPVREGVVSRVSNQGGEVTYWAMRESVAQPGVWFISADVREEGLVKGADGNVATWATRDPSGATADYIAMDEIARDHSAWSSRRGELDITDEGALGSRYCTVQLREDKWRDEFGQFA